LKLVQGLSSFLSIPALKRRRLMKNVPEQRTFSQIDYYRLQNILAHEQNPAYRQHLKRMSRLRGLLLQGCVCPCKKVASDLITMNSVLRLQSKRGTSFDITLVYPSKACPKDRKYSVLSGIGLSLIGKRQGDYAAKGMQVIEILYQPESDGKFYV